MHAKSEALETELGYQFRDRELLRRALTHKSFAREGGLPEVVSENEQLEFLGDSILGFLASEWVVAEFPDWTEGRLTKLKAYLVSASHLYRAAQAMKLGDYLMLGKGEELSGGRLKSGLLADAAEAVIAAVYLDGGIEAARRLVVDRILAVYDVSEAARDAVQDAKSELQELARELKLPQPTYLIVEERGPEHAKTFVVEVRVGRDLAGKAAGLSKKDAGQKAAGIVLQKLKER